MASKDPLTELDNRRMFNRALQNAMEVSVRDFQPASVLIVDVDHFKRINDTYGHPAGDDVLKALARRMEGALRTVDKVARLGGEEFGVLLPNSSKVGGRMVAERIRSAIEASPIPTGEGPIECTASIGGTTLDPIGHLAHEMNSSNRLTKLCIWPRTPAVIRFVGTAKAAKTLTDFESTSRMPVNGGRPGVRLLPESDGPSLP